MCLLIHGLDGSVQDQVYPYDHKNCEIEMPVCPSF